MRLALFLSNAAAALGALGEVYIWTETCGVRNGPCAGSGDNQVTDNRNPADTFVQHLQSRGPQSGLAAEDSPTTDFPGPTESTTTVTVTTPVVTSTMSSSNPSFNPSFTPVEGTTYHYSTTVPWVPPPSSINAPDGTPGISKYDTASEVESIDSPPTIVSNGTPVATITVPTSSFHVNPPPSITSASSLVTVSNDNTTTIVPVSSLSGLANSTTATNKTVSISPVSTVISFSLTTVDPPTEVHTHTSGMTMSSSAAESSSMTEAPSSNDGQIVKGGHKKVGVVLLVGLAMNALLFSVL